MHQRSPTGEMDELLKTSKITLNNDENKISDSYSMSDNRVKLCNNNESSNSCSVSSKGDLPFSTSFLSEEKKAIELHTFVATTRQEFPSVNCHCTLHRQNECFMNDVKSVPSVTNNLTGYYQKWKHRLTTSELLSHTRSVKKDDTLFQKSAYSCTNYLSRLHTWSILLAICIAFLCTTCNADPSECAKGINTPGWTSPAGDIVLEFGKPLRIHCILNKTMLNVNYPGKNASDVVFFRNNKEIEPEYTTVINETTVEMYIEEPPPSDDMYYCKLRISDEQQEAVCLNKVVIGFKPQKPENFNCISYNWENMVCSWDPHHNYITTKYSIYFKLPGRAGRGKLFPCPQEESYISQINSCTWDISTNPLYRQTYEYYLFILYGDNVLGNFTATYKIHHFAQVIPAKPANFTLLNKTSESAFLYWSAPFPVNNFPGGLHYRLAYQNQWDSQKSWQVINFTDRIQLKQKHYNLTDLKYANSVYDVRVYAKSSLAEDNMWSNFSDVTFRTLPKLPGIPPKTDIGSFELMENSGYRDVYLYWQTIPPYLENGDNFRYQILRVDADGRKISIQPSETTRTYAKFKGITTGSYRFEIVTTNVVGDSKNSSKIFVPSRTDLPREPVTFTKIAFDGGTYELSWKYPENSKKEITNFTIFWCDNERDRPYQCAGYLDWVHVSKNTFVYNMTVPDPKKVYQFAISANTKHASSGMVWASCTVIHNKVASKMKSVWINKIGSDYIEVGWKLDCSDRVGIVEGFNIYYCPIIAPYNRNCKEPKLNTTIKADTTTIHGEILSLKPYTTYKVTIAVLTKHGEGLHSDPLYNTTLEAAPSTSPQDVRIMNSTNTTITVTWKSPPAMNGVLRYYEVYYNCSKKLMKKRVDATYHSELDGFNAQENRNEQVVLTNLYAHEEYTVEIEACTVACSAKSSLVSKRTDIGTPGEIMVPVVRFVNSSQVYVIWNRPDISAGNLDYYQIASNDGEIQNSSRTEIYLPIADCKTVDQEKMYQFRVRAVNIAANQTHLTGPWSNTGEGNCYSNGPTFAVWILIWAIGLVSCCAFLLFFFYSSKRTWLKCMIMRDVNVKLPQGIEPNMKLLQKSGEPHTRQSSADSSGCSSGQESVTSSLTSDSHVSSDSGADVNPIAVSANKLLEIPTWNPTSLRQRNVGNMRPGGVTDSARWDPYVKVTKSGDTTITETLSIARSTPNLCDSTGSTTSQNTWSSTGYMSMPSSEEISNNSSPIPHKEAKSLGYSVVGMNPKSHGTILEEDRSQMVSTIEIKPSNPYVSLVSLEQKLNGPMAVDPLLELDISFPEIEESSNLECFSDKVSKPYVQSGFIDLGEKQKASFTPTLLVDAVSKPLVSSSISSPTAVHFTDISSKPYVTVASIPDLRSSTKILETSKPYAPLESASNSVFQMLQQQRNKSDLRTCNPQMEIEETEEEDPSNITLCWEPESCETELETKEKPRSKGYVTISETPKLDQPALQNQRFSKQQSNTQSEEQYSKVTRAPDTMQ